VSTATIEEPTGAKSARRSGFRLVRYVKPHARLVAYSTIALLLCSAANLVTPWVFKAAVDGPFEQWRLQQIGLPEFLDRIGELALIFAAIVVGRFGFQASQMVAMNLAGQRTMRDLRTIDIRSARW